MRPAYCTSSGLVLLAHRDEAFVERYLSLVPLRKMASRTITDKRLLRVLLKEILQNGWAEGIDIHIEGAAGVAAPIYGCHETAIGAFHLALPTARYVRARSQMRDRVLWGAAEVTKLLKGLGSREMVGGKNGTGRNSKAGKAAIDRGVPSRP